MRDVNSGWLLRYLHSNGASFFFIAVYVHILRGLYYGSYKAPRELLWVLGCINFLLMMATAFMGYVLPWGQMSFWGATVITSLFTAIPLVGDWIQRLLLGGFAVDNPTLNRFFALHYLLPFMLAGVVTLHIWALHVVGQNNPTGIDVKSKTDIVDFTPYATVKDAFGIVMFVLVFAYFVFYSPNYLGHPDNYIADPLKTPAHIVPEWYFLPFYAILRAITFNVGPIDSKLGGVLAMFGADRRAVPGAVARHVQGSLCGLPALVQVALLAVRRQRHLPRLAGLAAGGGCLRRHVPVGDALLFRVLHRGHAAARTDRDAVPAAELHNRSGPRQEQGGLNRRGRAPRQPSPPFRAETGAAEMMVDPGAFMNWWSSPLLYIVSVGLAGIAVWHLIPRRFANARLIVQIAFFLTMSAMLLNRHVVPYEPVGGDPTTAAAILIGIGQGAAGGFISPGH